MRALTATIALTAALTGCGDTDTKTEPDTSSAREYSGVQDVADELTVCDTFEPEEVLGADESGRCTIADTSIRISWFATDARRDAYLEIARSAAETGMASPIIVSDEYAIECDEPGACAMLADKGWGEPLQ